MNGETCLGLFGESLPFGGMEKASGGREKPDASFLSISLFMVSLN